VSIVPTPRPSKTPDRSTEVGPRRDPPTYLSNACGELRPVPARAFCTNFYSKSDP